MKNKILLIIIITSIFFGGFYVGFEKKHLGFPPPPRNKPFGRLEEGDCTYKFINPLRCETSLISEKPELAPLRKKLTDYISDEKTKGNANVISVYFRDLNSGPILTINSEEKFTPASLLKVPIMIAYYKLAETKPEILTEKIGKDYEPSSETVNIEDINKSINPRTEYTVDELIGKMIMYSDNRSKELLLLNLQKISPDEDLFLDTINNLGIIADTSNVDDFVSVKSMASIFRILYNASYLDNQMSEKALKLLSNSDFTQGLRNGIPLSVPIAQKFGVRNYENGEVQLHNCGVFYLNSDDYVLCVMTRGKDTNALINIVSTISQNIYSEIK